MNLPNFLKNYLRYLNEKKTGNSAKKNSMYIDSKFVIREEAISFSREKIPLKNSLT